MRSARKSCDIRVYRDVDNPPVTDSLLRTLYVARIVPSTRVRWASSEKERYAPASTFDRVHPFWTIDRTKRARRCSELLATLMTASTSFDVIR